MSDMLIWVDLETTGLDRYDHMTGVHVYDILEIGVHITDSKFNILDNGLDLIVYNDFLNPDITPYVHDMHSKNGLKQECMRSPLSLQDAEKKVIEYIKSFGIAEGTSPICGNNIGFDKNFIDAQMPELSKVFHYRKIDVSSFKEVAKRMNPEVASIVAAYKPNTEDSLHHRALSDIKYSIGEMQIYRDYFLKIGTVV